jgi:N-acetylmuramoyl-L-alanine amidase
MRKIDKIIIHCSATPEGRDVSTETIRQWHLKRGWSDIGYHYVIELDGKIIPGRPIERIGAHCRGENRSSIGICYVGGVNEEMIPKDTRTEAQRGALHSLLFDLTDNFAQATVHGHNEFSSKACPSFNVQTEL